MIHDEIKTELIKNSCMLIITHFYNPFAAMA